MSSRPTPQQRPLFSPLSANASLPSGANTLWRSSPYAALQRFTKDKTALHLLCPTSTVDIPGTTTVTRRPFLDELPLSTLSPHEENKKEKQSTELQATGELAPEPEWAFLKNGVGTPLRKVVQVDRSKETEEERRARLALMRQDWMNTIRPTLKRCKKTGRWVARYPGGMTPSYLLEEDDGFGREVYDKVETGNEDFVSDGACAMRKKKTSQADLLVTWNHRGERVDRQMDGTVVETTGYMRMLYEDKVIWRQADDGNEQLHSTLRYQSDIFPISTTTVERHNTVFLTTSTTPIPNPPTAAEKEAIMSTRDTSLSATAAKELVGPYRKLAMAARTSCLQRNTLLHYARFEHHRRKNLSSSSSSLAIPKTSDRRIGVDRLYRDEIFKPHRRYQSYAALPLQTAAAEQIRQDLFPRLRGEQWAYGLERRAYWQKEERRKVKKEEMRAAARLAREEKKKQDELLKAEATMAKLKKEQARLNSAVKKLLNKNSNKSNCKRKRSAVAADDDWEHPIPDEPLSPPKKKQRSLPSSSLLPIPDMVGTPRYEPLILPQASEIVASLENAGSKKRTRVEDDDLADDEYDPAQWPFGGPAGKAPKRVRR